MQDCRLACIALHMLVWGAEPCHCGLTGLPVFMKQKDLAQVRDRCSTPCRRGRTVSVRPRVQRLFTLSLCGMLHLTVTGTELEQRIDNASQG